MRETRKHRNTGGRMLIHFSFSNFLSFRDETFLDLMPTRGKKFPSHVLKQGNRNNVKALRFAAIFGANASGKSNFVCALSYMRDLVIGTQFSISKPIYDKFLLDDDYKSKPMSFRIEFIHKDIRYRYTLSLNDDKIIAETLSVVSGKKDLSLFERNSVGKVIVSPTWGEKERITGAIALLSQIRGKETVLGLANARGSMHVDNVYEWFSKYLHITTDEQENIYSLAKKHDKLLVFLSRKISEIDIGIKGVTLKDEAFSFPCVTNTLNELKKRRISEIHTLEFEYYTRSGTKKFFTLKESNGTKRMLHLLSLCYFASQGDYTFVIDEFDRSLHNYLTTWFLELFSTECNKTGSCSQLIFTSYDTSILNPSPIRDDEIWFVEKKETGAGRLFPLTEFDLPHKLNRRKAYLEGRFGAVPYLTAP